VSTITAYKRRIFADATSMLVFRGPANVALTWSIASGPGTVEALSNSTDDLGVACAIYRVDGTTGDAIIEAQHGL
jgi:hypothetical protein